MTDKLSPALFNRLLVRELSLFIRKAVTSLLPQGQTFFDNWHIDAIALVLCNLIEGIAKRSIINLPPQFLKSLICSVALPAFLLGRNPGMRIMCISYNAEFAKSLHGLFLKLVQSPWYQQAFNPRPVRAVVDWYETEQGGRRYAMSLDGKLTGYPADFIIVDDPINATEAFSKLKRESVNAALAGGVFSRLSNKAEGRILLVMQRLHAEDPSGFLLGRGGWDHLGLPAIAPVDRVIQLPYGKTHTWKQGEPLHANFCGLDTLDQVKRDIGSLLFNAQYLQEPILAGEALLKSQYLRTYDAAPFPGPSDLIVQSWDTAVKDAPSSDYSVCLTLLARRKQVFLLDVYRARVIFPDLCRQAVLLANKYKPKFILIEDAANGTPLRQSLQDKDQLEAIVGVRPDIAKEARVARHTYTLETNPLYLPRYAAWVDDFRAEFLSFPQTRHDDQVDALAQFYYWYDEYQKKVPFSFDMGFTGHNGSAHVARLTAPSPGEMLDFLRRSGLGPAL